MTIWPVAIAAVSAALLVGGALGAEPAEVHPGGAAGVGSAGVRIGVVLNALDNPFFVAMYEGARARATRLGLPAAVRAVANNADLAGQAAQVRALVAAGNDCYAVAPITATNLVSALRGTRRPIVLNSPIDATAAKRLGVRTLAYIGTDDFAAGRLAGERMAALLRGGGDVALLGGWAGNLNSALRLGGFERGIRGSPVRVIARATADYDRTKAEIAAETILRAHPGIAGFYAANDLMALGAADALAAAGKTGKVRVIGLDGIPEALDAVRAGSLSATVSQYPYVMGEMAVEACAAAARGATLPPRVEAPIALLTRADIARAIAAFPKPFQPYSDPFKRLLRKRG
jgi:ABC-type sugar transport system substrate-binding protein